MSSMVAVMAWPMCKRPVTFGGGMLITKGSPWALGSGLKYPLSSQNLYILGSDTAMSKLLGKESALDGVLSGGRGGNEQQPYL